MANIKLKFRPSSVNGKCGTLYYQVTHKRITRQQKTNYRIHAKEWDVEKSSIIIPNKQTSRVKTLIRIKSSIDEELKSFDYIIALFKKQGTAYTADDLFSSFNNREIFLFKFMKGIISSLKKIGKHRTAETYISALNSFRHFRQDTDIILNDINSETIQLYEEYLRFNGLSLNSSSFYMRILRAVYNRAVEKGFTEQRYPFKHVYTGISKTIKRALSLKRIKRLKELQLKNNYYIFARDMFLFSFYTRGMSFVDMAYLKKSDIQNGILTYKRRKTRQKLFVKWEKCMQEIVEKHKLPDSPYLLPIINPDSSINERKQYIYAGHNINKHLKVIGRKLGISIPLTMYCARHSWASIAKSKNVPLSIISESMGHDSENTTKIYLSTLDNTAIDKANKMIINLL